MSTPMNTSTSTDVQPITRVERGGFASVDQLVESLAQSPEELESFRKVANDRELLNTLVALRVKQKLSQSDIAQRLECSQGKISRMENGVDSTTSIGDLRKYVQAASYDISILIVRKHSKLADLVTMHTQMIRQAFEKLLKLAANDECMKNGTKKFAKDVLEVFVKNMMTTLNSFEMQVHNCDDNFDLPDISEDEYVKTNVDTSELVYA